MDGAGYMAGGEILRRTQVDDELAKMKAELGAGGGSAGELGSGSGSASQPQQGAGQ